MRIDIITGFPRLFDGPLSESMLGKARQKGLVEIHVHDLRDYTHDKHRTIDDTPYGGGAGMILKPEPIFECVETLTSERKYDDVILTTPQGERFDQTLAKRFSSMKSLIIICGHYKGVDQRVVDHLVTREVSIGDFVLTGGEYAATVIVDATVRLLPGVIGDAESLLTDSFMDERLDSGYYTRPAEYRGMAVPEVLISGDHKKIAEWREKDSESRTRRRRPDMNASPEGIEEKIAGPKNRPRNSK